MELYFIGLAFFCGMDPYASFFDMVIWPVSLGKKMRNYL